ncbi:MAG: hypothetical protein R2697_11315 [Ilumatobacteraceae bacterium]
MRTGNPDVPTRRPFRFTLKLLAFLAVIYYFVVPIVPDFRSALGPPPGPNPSCSCWVCCSS